MDRNETDGVSRTFVLAMAVRRLESAEYAFVKTVFGLSAWRARSLCYRA